MAIKFRGSPRTTTLLEAQQWLQRGLDDGVECPCCTQLAKVYKRKLNSAMAFVLILIDRRDGGEWIHVPSYINAQVKNPAVAAAIRGDWAKLTHWDLIEELVGERPDGSTRVGYYKITKNGRLFARNKLRVPRHIWLYDGCVIERQDSETVSITEALGDKFNYSELMAPSMIEPPKGARRK
jgi:hypothetical protein